MSLIPDIRSKEIKPLYPNTAEGQKMLKEKPENGYYQGYLNDEDANYLAGYDYAVEEMLAGVIFNISDALYEVSEDYEDDELEKATEELESVANEFLDKKLSNSNEDFDLASVKNPKARLILSVFNEIFNWAEMERDELGTSLIESMGKEEYKVCRERCMNGYKNAVMKQCEAWEKQRAEGFTSSAAFLFEDGEESESEEENKPESQAESKTED